MDTHKHLRPFSLLDYFWTSVSVGLRSLPGPYKREAMARIANPLSYPRFMEFDLALSRLGCLSGCRVLDVGSPKLPVLLIARHTDCELWATDIRDYFIAPTRHFLSRLGLSNGLVRRIHLETQDARAFTYQDDFFDRVYVISVVEHIPGSGDTDAIREIARVLRPGGIATFTVPFAADGYREEFVHGPVFERATEGKRTFYQRRYDVAALHSRLVDQSGLRLTDVTFFGEPRVQFEAFWNRIPMRWKAPLLWAQPFVAQALLKRLSQDDISAAVGVALTFEKQAQA